MPEIVFGIYGYDFSARAAVAGVDLIPLYAFPECTKRAEDRDELLLTGYGQLTSGATMVESGQVSLVRRLTDGMTFAQQQSVVSTRLIRLSVGDSVAAMINSNRLPPNLPIAAERHTSGEAIGNDTFFPGSRILFLEQFVDFAQRARPGDPLLAAIYRQIEVWRLTTPFVELEHFLTFSGLEILARAHGPHSASKNVAIPIAGYLASHGFAVTQTLAEEWAAARNAMFHKGELEATIKKPGKPDQVVRVGEQLFALGTLLADASLKQLGFDDGHINWNRWHDRQPFI